MGTIRKVDAEVLGHFLRVRNAVFTAVAAGHCDAVDVLRPECGGGQSCDQRGVDAAGQADHGGAEAALAHVVAQTHNECVEHARGADGLRLATGRAEVVEINQQHVFLEGAREADDLTRRTDDGA